MDSYLIAQKVYLALSHVRLSFQLDQLLCIPSRDSLRLSRREYHVLWYHLSNSLSRLAFYTEILFAGVSAVSFQTASFRSQLQLKFPRAHIFVFKIFVVVDRLSEYGVTPDYQLAPPSSPPTYLSSCCSKSGEPTRPPAVGSCTGDLTTHSTQSWA